MDARGEMPLFSTGGLGGRVLLTVLSRDLYYPQLEEKIMSLAAVPANSRELGHPVLVEGETPSLPGEMPVTPGGQI